MPKPIDASTNPCHSDEPPKLASIARSLLLADLSRYIVDVSMRYVTKAKVVNMGGAYAMGAPWLRFAARCNPEWSNDLNDWLAKMTGHRGHRVSSRSASGGCSAVHLLVHLGGPELVPGVAQRRAAGTCARQSSQSFQSSR